MERDFSFSRTEAYNLLKGLLGIPKNALINQRFFCLFFESSYDGYEPKMPTKEIERIIKTSDIPELNRQYHEAKKSGGHTGPISKEIYSRVDTLRNKLVA